MGNDWNNQQRFFCGQFSKLGQTPEELSQRWKSFQFDETTDTIDSYLLRLKQCAQILGYNEGQVFELFKNTVPARYSYFLFSIQNLRKVGENAKRVMTKEKLNNK